MLCMFRETRHYTITTTLRHQFAILQLSSTEQDHEHHHQVTSSRSSASANAHREQTQSFSSTRTKKREYEAATGGMMHPDHIDHIEVLLAETESTKEELNRVTVIALEEMELHVEKMLQLLLMLRQVKVLMDREKQVLEIMRSTLTNGRIFHSV
ncbi:hypothetical protein L914_16580 [Phytophthora nicotianae]|uniref:Uncharacterized protein n=5 Tax=Phytophthora nicotianae TaxID=4792 RepID=V9EC35_PHYNI|nr:hypothetical protein F443_17205 [Phytophthora nicotianae P1569]ETM36775.1 hypothetical protein L914_16580 [Phytophthora nicotianae]